MPSELQSLFNDSNAELLEGAFSKLNQQKDLNLTELEKEISVLLWLNFDHYEIAQLLSIEVADVEMEQERIRQKLTLKEGHSIRLYVQQQLD